MISATARNHPMPFISRLKYLHIIPWLLITALPGAAPRAAPGDDPSALWKIDHGKCVPDMRKNHKPEPCKIVDLSVGYVVLKDRTGLTQYLLLPTARISGIESPAVLAPGVPNYWDWAWRARTLTEDRAGKALPREALSLAVNSPFGRSQDQLHIHIDCVQKDVRAALAANSSAIGGSWAAFPVTMVGQTWRALRVDGDNLGTANPFDLLAKGDPAAAADMGKH